MNYGNTHGLDRGKIQSIPVADEIPVDSIVINTVSDNTKPIEQPTITGNLYIGDPNLDITVANGGHWIKDNYGYSEPLNWLSERIKAEAVEESKRRMRQKGLDPETYTFSNKVLWNDDALGIEITVQAHVVSITNPTTPKYQFYRYRVGELLSLVIEHDV